MVTNWNAQMDQVFFESVYFCIEDIAQILQRSGWNPNLDTWSRPSKAAEISPEATDWAVEWLKLTARTMTPTPRKI